MAPMNSGGDGIFETTRIFHDASPASVRPAFKPTRGSGVGAVAGTVVTVVAPPAELPEEAHPATVSRTVAAEKSANARRTMYGAATTGNVMGFLFENGNG